MVFNTIVNKDHKPIVLKEAKKPIVLLKIDVTLIVGYIY